jgi:hypothetical protein
MAIERRSNHRRETDRDIGLDRDDLFLLLESYRNTIELNTTLLERQEVLNRGLEKILAEIIKICGNQADIAADIAKLPGDIRASIETLCSSTVKKCEEVGKTIDNHRAAEVKEHAGLTLRIYAAFSVLGALAVALVGLLIKIWPNLSKTPIPFPGP